MNLVEPTLKIYDDADRYVASCKFFQHAAAIVAVIGDGATVRWHHKHNIYTQGKDGDATTCYEVAAETMRGRVLEIVLDTNESIEAVETCEAGAKSDQSG